MTSLERLQQAAVMLAQHFIAGGSAIDDNEAFMRADEEMREAAIAFRRSLPERTLARIRRFK